MGVVSTIEALVFSWVRSQRGDFFSTIYQDTVGQNNQENRFTRLPAPLTRSLAPHYSIRSRAPLRSLVPLLAHSLAHGTLGERMIGWLFILYCFLFWLI